MLSEHLEDEPWHDPLRHSLGASRVFRRACPTLEDRSPAGFEKLELEHLLKTFLDMAPGTCRWNSSSFVADLDCPSRSSRPRYSLFPQGNIEAPPLHLFITRKLEQESGIELGIFTYINKACCFAGSAGA